MAQRLIPGAGYVDETGSAQRLIPGGGYVEEVTTSGASDTPINPGVGALALTGYAPAVTQSAHQSLAPGAGSLAITGYAPTVAQSSAAGINPGAGALTLTGYAPTVARSAHQAVSPEVGTLVITGYAPSITQESASRNLAPDAGLLVITGYAPTIAQSGQATGMAMFGGAGGYAETRRFADLLTKAGKKKRRKRLEVIALELLPDEPQAELAAPIIANLVFQQEARIAAIARKVDAAEAMPPAVASFDAAAEVRRMVEQWMRNEAIARQLADEEDEREIELLLMG